MEVPKLKTISSIFGRWPQTKNDVFLTVGGIDFDSRAVQILLVLPIVIPSNRPQSEAHQKDDC